MRPLRLTVSIILQRLGQRIMRFGHKICLTGAKVNGDDIYFSVVSRITQKPLRDLSNQTIMYRTHYKQALYTFMYQDPSHMVGSMTDINRDVMLTSPCGAYKHIQFKPETKENK